VEELAVYIKACRVAIKFFKIREEVHAQVRPLNSGVGNSYD
jgi:hypothetical protein